MYKFHIVYIFTSIYLSVLHKQDNTVIVETEVNYSNDYVLHMYTYVDWHLPKRVEIIKITKQLFIVSYTLQFRSNGTLSVYNRIKRLTIQDKVNCVAKPHLAISVEVVYLKIIKTIQIYNYMVKLYGV